MDGQLRRVFEHEMREAMHASRAKDLPRAFAHLERAHILSQRHTFAHVHTHWAMLKIGYQRRDRREIVGQLARMLAALIFSRIWVPIGNTGGANVSATQSMPIPEDLRALLEKD